MRSRTLISIFTLLVSCTTMTYEAQKNKPLFGTYSSENNKRIIKLYNTGSYEYITPNLYYTNSFSRGNWSIDNEGLVLKDSLTFNKLKMEVNKVDTNIKIINIKINYTKTYYSARRVFIEFWIDGYFEIEELEIDNNYSHLDSFRFVFYGWPSNNRPIKTSTYVPNGKGIYIITFENVDFRMRNIEINNFEIRYNVLSKPTFISKYNDYYYYNGR